MTEASGFFAGVGGAGALILALLWFLMRAYAKMRDDFNDFRVHVAEDYVAVHALDAFKKEVLRRFDKLEKLVINGGHND